MVQFRLIQIPVDAQPACGFALCFNTKQESDVFFDTLVSAYEAKTPRKIYTDFINTSEGILDLHLMVDGKEDTYNVDVNNIESQYVDALVLSLNKYGYVFILTAFSSDENVVNINKGNYAMIGEFSINGENFSGKNAPDSFPTEILKELIA